tara:strand:+ start:100 stop:423 length:324 start_codon:yes stop_codon:yes gene_type:complete
MNKKDVEKDRILECLESTLTEMISSTGNFAEGEMTWTNADLFLKSTDNVVVKFKIGYTDKGTVTGKITTFTLDENGDPQPFDLSDLMKSDEKIKLTPEEAPEGTLLN